MAQAVDAKSRLEALNRGIEIEIVPIKTSGDHGLRERVGAFVGEIQDACLSGQIDIGLHCLKDLPVEPVDGLTLAAHFERGDARDAFLSPFSNLDDLPQGAIVGTGSVRRSSQLAAVRPDLTFRPLVGNVDTRLRKLSSGEYDAIILAIAGLDRIGLLSTWDTSEFSTLNVVPLSLHEMLPAPGQAVLVLETRADDAEAIATVSGLEHPPTRACASAERLFLSAFGGGCSMPVAAYGSIIGDGQVELEGLVAEPCGARIVRGSSSCNSLESVASQLAEKLTQQGARELIAQVEVAKQ
jgi:hydroxymethylbilane synthase